MSGFRVSVQRLWDHVQQHTASFLELRNLDAQEVLDMVEEINQICVSIFDKKPEALTFCIPADTSFNSWIWKAKFRVECQKVNCGTHNVLSSRLLNLKQFCLLYRELRTVANMIIGTVQCDASCDQLADGSASSITASMVWAKTVPLRDDTREECCICMERPSEVLLSCAHAYCQQCLLQWRACCDGAATASNVRDRPLYGASCPVCRAALPSAEGHPCATEPWLITEVPDLAESCTEMSEVMLRLAERTGQHLPL